MENMQQPRLTFSKGERLCNYHRIQKLFQEGNSLKKYPIKLLYLAVDSQEINNQVLISVPKRKVRRAVHRNRIKRLIRESYRKQKSLLSSSYSLAFVYMGKCNHGCECKSPFCNRNSLATSSGRFL